MPPFGPLPRVWYVVGALAACILVTNGVLAWRQGRASARVVTIREQIRVTDTLYTRDTVRLYRAQRLYKTVRDTLVQHKSDTVLVTRFIEAADDAQAACDSALHTGERRDSLHRKLEGAIAHASAPRPLVLYGEALAGYQWQAPEIRAGATMRLTKRVQVVGEVVHRLDDGRTVARAGLRVVF